MTNLMNMQEVSDKSMDLLAIVARFRDGEWQVPQNIQREEGAWNLKKRTLWIRDLLAGTQPPTGLIVYRRRYSETLSPFYLLDGLQRVTTTIEGIDYPIMYGIQPGELETAIKNMQLPVRQFTVSTEAEALEIFQKANSGTPLTPYEYYKGVVTLTGAIGLRLYAELPRIVEKAEHNISKPIKQGKAKVYNRGALALFVQYATGTKLQTFWDYAAQDMDRQSGKRQTEQELADYVKQYDESKISRQIGEFERYINDLAGIITVALVDYNGGRVGDALPRTLVRALFHLGIYRKNTGAPVERYTEFVTAIMRLRSPRKDGVITYLNENGNEQDATISMQRLGELLRIAQSISIDFGGPVKRINKTSVAPGFHSGHIAPVSIVGDGPHNSTRPEPALINMANGNRTYNGRES